MRSATRGRLTFDGPSATSGRRRRRRQFFAVSRQDERETTVERSPFPLSAFESSSSSSVPPAARFLWSSSGQPAPSHGLRALRFDRDWLESASDKEKFEKEMRVRRALLANAKENGVVVWSDEASDAAEECLKIAVNWLCERYPERYAVTEDGCVRVDEWTSDRPVEEHRGRNALVLLGHLIQEDLCFMRPQELDDGSTTYVFNAGVVCFSFDPQKRRDKALRALHAPVPDYESKMSRVVDKIFDNLHVNRPMWRANWAVQNSDEIITTDAPWHPSNRAIGGVEMRSSFDNLSKTFADEAHVGYMDPLSDLPTRPEDVPESMFLRVEYETIVRLPRTGYILFTIHTYLDALGDFDEECSAALLRAMRQSSAKELDYKSLGHEPLRQVVEEYLTSAIRDRSSL